MIFESQIKKLQQTINRQLENNPLSKKMKSSQIFDQINQKPSKVNAIMQTSSDAPQNFNKKLMKNKQPKKSNQNVQKIQKVKLPQKSQEEKKKQQKQFLISQNKLLKQQTLSLVEQLQTLLSDQKQRKYGINIDDEQQLQQIKLKKVIIAQQLAKITKIQNTIAYEKRQLKYVFDDQAVTAQEAQIKILQKQLQKLQKEKKAVIKILKQQNKGISQIEMTPQFKQKFQKTKQQLDKIKQECKSLQTKTLQNERLLKKRHEKAVGQQAKIKKIQKLLKQKQEKKKKGITNDKYVTLEMIAEVQQQIAELQSERMQSQKSWSTRIANIESQLQARKLQEERKILILKEKQKQVRLNDLRIKELKKLFQTNVIEKRKSSISKDESKKQQINLSQLNQGRKRNIKFIQSKDRQTINVQNS